jgi:hypothetical protein
MSDPLHSRQARGVPESLDAWRSEKRLAKKNTALGRSKVGGWMYTKREPVPKWKCRVNMFKASFVVAFVLTVITYAIFLWLQPVQPLDAKSTLVVFAFWFGVAALFGWFLNRRKTKRKP